MITVRELQDWLNNFPEDTAVYITDDDLTADVDCDAYVVNTYIAVGGLPEVDDE
jgi:hypothetical protein